MSIAFTERELDIMSVLWERGPSTVAEIRADLSGTPAYTTVQTLVKILEEKGHVGHVEEGRAHRFHPLVRREDAGRSMLQRAVRTVFGGSASALVNNLVRDDRLSRDELEALRAQLDARLNEMERDDVPAARRHRTPPPDGHAR